MRRVLLLDVAALSASQLGEHTPNLSALAKAGTATPLVPPFGALTCPAHISMSTGVQPAQHGIVANGWYEKDHARWFNWNRSNRLVQAPQIWDQVKAKGGTTASLFWRHTAHSAADVKVIERPTYWASGKKTFDFYTEPGALHGRAKSALGAFPFPFFWGPLAGWKSTQWILDLTRQVLTQDTPTLTLSYAPFMDYDGQRFGPDDPRAVEALKQLDQGLGPIIELCGEQDIDLAIVSDYGFVTVDTPVYLNRVLRQAGYIEVHDADNGEFLEAGNSRAFAHCDNQVAHVYVNDPKDVDAVALLLGETPGVKAVLGPGEQSQVGLDHPRSGDLVCVAEPNAWFHYPYWLDPAKAPDYARCIAIFDKPGFDPTELFGSKARMGWRVLQKKLSLAVPFDVVDDDATQVRGARNADQSDIQNGALLITSWGRESPESLPMEAVHDLLLSRVG